MGASPQRPSSSGDQAVPPTAVDVGGGGEPSDDALTDDALTDPPLIPGRIDIGGETQVPGTTELPAAAGSAAAAIATRGAGPPGLRLILGLLAGRTTFRMVQLLSSVLLLPLWGTERYGVYAAAVASFSFVIALLQSGPEKAVLKLLPRAPRSGPQITELFCAILWVLVPLSSASFLLSAWVFGDRPAIIYLGVATQAIGSGTLLLLAGFHRVTGHPRYDPYAALAMTIAQIGVLLAVVAGLGPLGYLLCYTAAQLVVNLVLLKALGRPSLRIRRRPGFLGRVLWTTLHLGLPEVCLYLVTTVTVGVLTTSRWSSQVGQLFAVTLVWSAGITFVLYGLRIFIPHVSRRLLRDAAPARRAVRRIAVCCIGYDVLWLLGTLLAVEFTGLQELLLSGQAWLGWSLVLVLRTPSDVALLFAGFLLENTDARSTRVTAMAAIVTLAVCSVAAFLLIPQYGGVGLCACVVIGGIAQAMVLLGHPRVRGQWTSRRVTSST